DQAGLVPWAAAVGEATLGGKRSASPGRAGSEPSAGRGLGPGRGRGRVGDLGRLGDFWASLGQQRSGRPCSPLHSPHRFGRAERTRNERNRKNCAALSAGTKKLWGRLKCDVLGARGVRTEAGAPPWTGRRRPRRETRPAPRPSPTRT